MGFGDGRRTVHDRFGRLALGIGEPGFAPGGGPPGVANRASLLEREKLFGLSGEAARAIGDGQRESDPRFGEQFGPGTFDPLADLRRPLGPILVLRGVDRELRDRLAGVIDDDLPLGPLHPPRRFAAGIVLDEPRQGLVGQRMVRVALGEQFERPGGQRPAAGLAVPLGKMIEHAAGVGVVHAPSQFACLGQPLLARERVLLRAAEDRADVPPLLGKPPQRGDVLQRRIVQQPPGLAAGLKQDAAEEVLATLLLRQLVDHQVEGERFRADVESLLDQPPRAAAISPNEPPSRSASWAVANSSVPRPSGPREA